jgi:signal transduction histidine kinase
MRVLNVNLTEIYHWDREFNQLQTQARSFRTSWPTGQGPLLKLDEHPALHHALNTGQCVVVKRGSGLSSDEKHYLDHSGVDGIQIIPVVGGDQTLGAIQVYYIHRPDKWPDAETLQRVQHTTLEVLVALSNQTNQARMQGIFRTVEEINRATGADWCELALYTPDKRALAVNLALGKGVWLADPRPSLDLLHYPDLVDAIESQSLINKQGDSKMMTAGIRTLLDNANSRAVLGIPLIQRGQTQGMVLFADVRRLRIFSQRDIDMGRALVGQAATALENASLVHDLEKSLHDLRDTQDRLVQTARLSAMGELAAAVAHQINNPLTTIMVDSEMMLLDEQPDSRNYRSLQAISRAGKRAAGVARRLLAIARPNDPESPPERIDVVDTIEGVLALVKAHIERDHIQIIPNMPEEKLPPVWAVPGQLDDIWLNLLLNAHDALIGREDAKMGINASYQHGSDAIEVIAWDNGPGIPAKIIDEVFKPFFTTKPVGEGTGLGLHICRQTAERIGGSISVESVPDQGTRFLVRLPVKQGG